MGYQIVEDMELLGFTIYKDTSKITNNWAKVVEKLTKKIHNWKIFNLSIQGRIVVAKSHLLSSVQYIGTILPLNFESEELISGLIESFVQGGGKKKQKINFMLPSVRGA